MANTLFDKQLQTEVIKVEDLPQQIAMITAGGLMKQVLTKNSNTPGDYSWTDINVPGIEVGGSYLQGINDPTPLEMGLLGTWSVWSNRAEAYNLDIGGITPRRLIQKWTDSDFTVNQVISGGSYNGRKVNSIITAAGTFRSIEGGNRPAFITGGVQGDRIRSIYGSARQSSARYDYGTDGAFNRGWQRYHFSEDYNAWDWGWYELILDLSLISYPVGSDISPTNISTRLWRRIS